jgi:hypothetical protein
MTPAEKAKFKGKTLEQHWEIFHTAVAKTIVNDAQFVAMKMCYYAGVRAMMLVCQDAFPDLDALTPRQRELMIRSMGESKAQCGALGEYLDAEAQEEPETRH